MSHPNELRVALEKIMRIANESSEQSRRMTLVHDVAMRAVGLTFNQRTARHEKAMQRSEKYKEDVRIMGMARAKKVLAEAIEAETGEPRMKIPKTQETLHRTFVNTSFKTVEELEEESNASLHV